MTYVITQSCCNDASCVAVCPVDCIHPTPDEPGFGSAEMLYIHPDDCIDCGACVDACPVSAIYPDFELPEHLEDYLLVNADYYTFCGDDHESAPPQRPAPRIEREGPLRVAVVGAGPAGWFVADELAKTRRTTAEVTVIDRLATPHGLVRYGVAPDHLLTKRSADIFDRIAHYRSATVRLGLEVGRDLTHADLLDTHHAVVYATGTPQGRSLELPGEALPGNASAAEFVGWYNGQPDHAGQTVDLTHSRAVIIGNGNVALDMARVLLLPAERLHDSEIAPAALAALADSSVEEVVLLGRRGAAHAAFTSPELRALVADPDIDVVVDEADAAEVEAAASSAATDAAGFALTQKAALLSAAARAPLTGARRLVLRFNTSPVEVLGSDSVTGLLTSDGQVIQTGLLLRATGYRTDDVAGLAVDASAGRFHHDAGRVLDPTTGEHVAGTYAAGWVKRGPSGVIGTNRSCAAETVQSLLDDYAAGHLAEPDRPAAFDAIVSARGLPVVGFDGWAALDAYEIEAGRAVGRPRIKVVDAVEQMKIVHAS